MKGFVLTFSENIVNFTASRCNELPPEETAVIMPTRRATLYLREELKHSNRLLPAIFSWDDFLYRLYLINFPPASIPSKPQLLWLLYKTSSGWKSFSRFIPWGERILSAFEEMDIFLLGKGELRNIEELGKYEEGIAKRIWENISGHKHAFEAELSKRRFVTRGMYYKQLALKDTLSLPWKNVIISGLSFISKAESEIIRKIDAEIEIVFQKEGDWEGLSELEKLVDEREFVGEAGKPEIYIYSSSDIHGEAVKAGEILRKSENVALILPDNASLFPVLQFSLYGVEKEFNVSMGYPLEKTPLFRLIEIIGELHQSFSEDSFSFLPYLKLISHPYVKNLQIYENKDAIRKLATVLRNKFRGIYRISLKDTMESVSEIKNDVLKFQNLFIESLRDIKTPGELAGKLRSIIEKIKDFSPATNNRIFKLSYYATLQSLEEIEKAEFADIRFPEEELYSIFSQFFKPQRLPFTGTPLAPIQVLGLLETRALSFKRIVVFDVNEGVLPSIETVDPVFPQWMRRAFGLPSYKRKEELFRYNFLRLIKGAEEAHIMYVEAGDKRRSRFIEEVIWEEEKKEGNILRESEKEASIGKLKKISIEIPMLFRKKQKLELKKNEIVMESLEKFVFSPTSIDEYISCPMKFYFHHILQLKAPEKEEFKRGSVIHEALEKYLREEIGVGNEIKPEKINFEKFEIILEELWWRSFKRSGKNSLILNIAKLKTKELINRISEEGALLLGLEMEISSDFPVKERKIHIKGKIDRVDYRNDKYIIIDYKTGTGKVPSSRLEAEQTTGRKEISKKIKSFQLPLYIYMFVNGRRNSLSSNPPTYENTEAVLKLIVKNKEVKYSLQDESTRNTILSSLREVLEEILNPEIPFSSDPISARVCEYCPFKAICSVS